MSQPDDWMNTRIRGIKEIVRVKVVMGRVVMGRVVMGGGDGECGDGEVVMGQW